MAALLEEFLIGRFLVFTLVLARVSGLVMTAPVFGSQSAPMQVRGLLAVALALLVFPAQAAAPAADPGSLIAYLVLIGQELLLGITIGLGVHILMTGVQVAGQIIGQLSGMMLADVFNPAFDAESPLVANLMFYLVMAVFVLIGGHLQVVAALLDTFQVLPPGTAAIGDSVVATLVTALAQSFSVGIRAAAPVMTALLLATFIMGLISRTLPQLNILAVGFGLNSLVTIGGLMLTLGGVAWVFQEQVVPLLDDLHQALLDDQGAAPSS